MIPLLLLRYIQSLPGYIFSLNDLVIFTSRLAQDLGLAYMVGIVEV